MSDQLLGKLVWYELLTSDLNAADAFYSDIVGWTVNASQGSGGQPYHELHNKAGKPIGGMMTLPPGMNVPPHWVMYIGTPKLGDASVSIEQHGGSAMSPVIDIPNIGRVRTMRDPFGAMFDIFEPSSSEAVPPDAQPGLGDVAWHELYSDDGEKAMQFYRDVFGWRELDTFDMGPMGKYRLFGRSFQQGGIMTKPPEMAQVPSYWGLYFRVSDVDADAGRVKARGGQVLNGPMDVPGGDRVVQCMDPQGAAFSLYRPKA